jgi:para-nitrobenzyl esterase
MVNSRFSAGRRIFLTNTSVSLVALPAILASKGAIAQSAPIVDTENGRLSGMYSDGMSIFKGIPYAASTEGLNRFMAPQPVKNWAGVRDCSRLGDRCLQERETFAEVPILSWYRQTGPMSEDCCVLNVFTPSTDHARRPVMVYIHGGAYTTGGGGGDVLDGQNLARFGDVVVVTLNHRLNVFGYTNLDFLGDERFSDAPNAGQLDLVAALKWIKANIAMFGGNPECVTLFGQSGGGSKIEVLMGMPAAKGLFHRAISMSGATGTMIAPPSTTEPYVSAMLENLGVGKGNLTALQQVSGTQLLNARSAALSANLDGARPTIDSRHVFSSPMTPEGLRNQATVPLLMGNANTEASLFLAADPRNLSLSERQVMDRLEAQFGIDDEKAASIMAAYRQDGPDRTPSDVLIALITDTLFRVPMLRAAQAKANVNQAPVYVYNFTWKTPVDGGKLGSPHTIDIPFAFGNVDKAQSLLGDGEDRYVVARNLMSRFVAFAREGNPNNSAVPAWKPYDRSSKATMTVSTNCEVVDNYHGADLAAGTALPLDPFNAKALFRYKA